MRSNTPNAAVVGGLLLIGIAALAAPARAANCGGNIPCNCDDTVVTNTTLTKDLTCRGQGLTVMGGVRLDLGGHTLAGFKTQNGVRIAGDRATVVNGIIRDFRTGVGGQTSDSTIDELSVATNSEGITLSGNGNKITRNEVVNNGLGISVHGDRNVVNDRNAVFGNSEIGIEVVGDGNVIDNNDVGERGQVPLPYGNARVPARNGCVGIEVTGDGNTVQANDIYMNNLVTNAACHHDVGGIDVRGDRNSILKNKVGDRDRGNGGIGIELLGNGNVISENKVMANAGAGIRIQTRAGAPNLLRKNVVGDRTKGNSGDGIVIRGQGAGANAASDLVENMVRSNSGSGIVVAAGAAGHKLEQNTSGGVNDQRNGNCAFDVAPGNFAHRDNYANTKILIATGVAPFPTKCIK